ncbi:penicillin-binding protein [Aquibacillus kalidii]|uniref:penicillin-binding protein n=1 Tax=Aquibacillus kalidii TaxID=2762597 RepID=UPI002E2D0C8B|nr:penicillin-binding protein [Aquibacillus kalidii]
MKKNKTTQFMSTVLMLLFVVMFLTLSGRFLYIQGTGEVSGVSLKDWAKDKRTNTYQIDAARGTIFDRKGMPLAQDRVTYRIQAIVDESYTTDKKEPKHVTDLEHTAEVLAPLLDMETSEILKSLNNGIENDRFQVEFGMKGKDLSQEKKDKIAALDLPGITFLEESKRYYPNGMFASHIIGLAQKQEVTKENNGQKLTLTVTNGVTGIEKQLDDQLTGTNGSISYERDKYNVKLLEPNEIIKEAKDGDEIYLTIDQKIQTLLEDSMSQIDKQYKPERMTAIVVKAKTGEVLAMSNRPSYNPNDLGEVENWYNDAISTPFEPGSTMKIFTLASAIEEGVWNPNEYYQSGRYSNKDMGSGSINDWDSWGEISFLEGIQRSSNKAAAILAYEKIGPDKFLDYLKKFDFDQPTGINLPGENTGVIQYNWPIEKVTTAFGQGTTTTPIQLVKAATAITNNGKMLKPFVISKVVDSETGKVKEEYKTEEVGSPISENTSKQVLDILGTVITSEHGTGKAYKLNDYSVAGKTGTAQIPDTENLYPGPYLEGEENYIFSFLGMAPKEEPELIMYVSVKQPDLNLEKYEPGSAPVSFIFKNVMENSLRYLKIQPDSAESEPIHSITVPEMVGKTVTNAKQSLEQLGASVTVVGDGAKIVKASVSEGEEVLPNERILLITDAPKMPDVNGWSLRDVLKLSDLIELDLEVMGNGYAKTQNVKKGTTIKANDYLMVEFSPPSSNKTNANAKSEKSKEENTNNE